MNTQKHLWANICACRLFSIAPLWSGHVRLCFIGFLPFLCLASPQLPPAREPASPAVLIRVWIVDSGKSAFVGPRSLWNCFLRNCFQASLLMMWRFFLCVFFNATESIWQHLLIERKGCNCGLCREWVWNVFNISAWLEALRPALLLVGIMMNRKGEIHQFPNPGPTTWLGVQAQNNSCFSSLGDYNPTCRKTSWMGSDIDKNMTGAHQFSAFKKLVYPTFPFKKWSRQLKKT